MMAGLAGTQLWGRIKRAYAKEAAARTLLKLAYGQATPGPSPRAQRLMGRADLQGQLAQPARTPSPIRQPAGRPPQPMNGAIVPAGNSPHGGLGSQPPRAGGAGQATGHPTPSESQRPGVSGREPKYTLRTQPLQPPTPTAPSVPPVSPASPASSQSGSSALSSPGPQGGSSGLPIVIPTTQQDTGPQLPRGGLNNLLGGRWQSSNSRPGAQGAGQNWKVNPNAMNRVRGAVSGQQAPITYQEFLGRP